MGHREIAIEHLLKLMSRNYLDGKLYLYTAENCKRLFANNIFKKLAHQKRSFYQKIKEEILVLYDEIILLGGNKNNPVENLKLEEPQILPVFRKEQGGLIKECYRREKQTLGMYNNVLTKVNIGTIREMLLFQKHSIQMILFEIESMGFKIFEEFESDKNEPGKKFEIE